jgi:hypothetical protein
MCKDKFFNGIALMQVLGEKLTSLFINNIPAFLDNWLVFMDIPALARFQKWKSIVIMNIPALFLLFFGARGNLRIDDCPIEPSLSPRQRAPQPCSAHAMARRMLDWLPASSG